MEITKTAILEAFAYQIINNPEEYQTHKRFGIDFEKSIDGIKCDCKMVFSLPKNEVDKYECYWNIIIKETRTNKIVYGNFKNCIDEYSKECIIENIKKCIELVNGLHFNILMNRMIKNNNNNLIDEIKNDSDERQIFAALLFTKDDDEMKCSVCLENTTNTLKCDHYLCMSCIHKMKKGLCPLCRRGIHANYCDCEKCLDDNDEEWNCDDDD
jgi:hypothetical protein